MDQESLSEIVFGQLLNSKIVRDTVRPEIFVSPFHPGNQLFFFVITVSDGIQLIGIKLRSTIRSLEGFCLTSKPASLIGYIQEIPESGLKNYHNSSNKILHLILF